MGSREEIILDYISKNKIASSKQIFENSNVVVSYATVKRILSSLITQNFVETSGKGKGTKYAISKVYNLLKPINLDNYYQKEIDERNIRTDFNTSLITDTLQASSLFTKPENSNLESLQGKFKRNISELTEAEYQKEMERLAIDLSWKSSQIEGNTYSLLETEKLLKEKETAAGKTKEEAIMLLNHKEALDFIVENPDYLEPLSITKIEDIHGILVKDLNVERNIRRRRVGISGTNYRPLDNEFLIRESLTQTCNLVNNKSSIFEKALLTLVLLAYIQPFMDGNKRTARIVSNAILINNKHCPLSFRTVDSIDYKKAMLLFYEQNNISSFKEIFVNQFEFAVNTYF